LPFCIYCLASKENSAARTERFSHHRMAFSRHHATAREYGHRRKQRNNTAQHELSNQSKGGSNARHSMVARCAARGRRRAYADARHLVERTGFSEPRHVRGFFSVCTSYPAVIIITWATLTRNNRQWYRLSSVIRAFTRCNAAGFEGGI